ncbi:LOW QUALITY PROTEIN: taste receptor type 2 member 10 [Meles meles]|uniref:LOW QUALITY PROTEIN: taste receptor type 2 member 10 n=1 Tax=Meles meles TaxID=9662 RepID=UPI001E6A0437|nr:LOW QUALITY PROTEIN: taste receptor type 2 member 10 [Meles meles]
MISILEGLLIFIAVSEAVLGVLGNGFIGLVNCVDCVKNKKFSMIGFILTGLATSRIFLILLIITDAFIKLFSPDMYYSGNLIDCISYLWIIINQSSIWFATGLSIFYFLKIANFSHHIFLWLKGRINRVLYLLMGSLFISWLFTFPQIVKIINDNRMRSGNTTWDFNITKSTFLTKQILVNLGVILLLTLCLVTCFLLIISLWRHNRRMQLKVTGPRDPSTEAHVKAMKVLISFIFLFILYFIGIVIEIACFNLPENRLLFLFGMITAAIYPWGHSLILILGNSKLKRASLRALGQCKCCEAGTRLTAHRPTWGEMDVLGE